MKKHLLLLFAALLPLVASAHDFYENGIYYNITSETDKTVEVTYRGDSYGSYDDEYSGSITVPATVTHNGVAYSVTSIGDYAFYQCPSLKSITIPEGVTSIGGGAFYGTEWYNNQPDGVVYIGKVLYKYKGTMPENTAIEVKEGTVSISPSAFYNCSSLTAITLPASVTSIGDWAFEDCSSLTAITLPEDSKLTSIENYAFYYCYSLKSITLPEGVTSIGREAFYCCYSLKSITLPEGVTSIGGSAFYDCSSLKTVINYSDLPLQRGSTDYGNVARYADRVINIDEVIDGYAFKTIEGMHYLTGYIGDKTELTLPTDYKGANYQIGEYAFNGCISLTTITLPEGVTSIEKSTFQGCSSLTSITIPEGVTSIGERAFEKCSSLTAITIPEGVTSIGQRAFNGCESLKELTLGKELKKIGVAAFYGCTALEKVTIYATRPPSIEGTGNAFFSDATYENATLYVPQGCIDKYQVMAGWSSFYTIEEMEGGTPNYLTLRQADNGEVGIVVDLGRTYKVRITAFKGWKIHSVTFNGEEVTAQLTEEGLFTTPALQADAVLNIAYEKIEDNAIVANARARAIKVQGHRGTLRITGTTEGEAISVYTTGGTLAAQESAEGDETLITLPTDQVYIVTVADKVVKIGM